LKIVVHGFLILVGELAFIPWRLKHRRSDLQNAFQIFTFVSLLYFGFIGLYLQVNAQRSNKIEND